MKGRRWTEEEDQLLRDTVLASVVEGRTQIEAFKEVGKKLGRTPGACGFRWNAVLRPKYAMAYAEAKKKRVYDQIQKKKGYPFSSLSEVIQHLRQLDKTQKQLREKVVQLQKQIEEKNQVIHEMKEAQRRLQDHRYSFDSVKQELFTRYQELLNLMEYLRSQPEVSSEIKKKKAVAEHIAENLP